MALNNKNEINKIEGIIKGLEEEIKHLAPAPDFLLAEPVMLDLPVNDNGALGGEFTLAANEQRESLSHHFHDAEYALPAITMSEESTQIKMAFNHANLYAQIKTMQEKAYYADLPRRVGLERWVEYYKRRLAGLKKQFPALRLAA